MRSSAAQAHNTMLSNVAASSYHCIRSTGRAHTYMHARVLPNIRDSTALHEMRWAPLDAKAPWNIGLRPVCQANHVQILVSLSIRHKIDSA